MIRAAIGGDTPTLTFGLSGSKLRFLKRPIAGKMLDDGCVVDIKTENIFLIVPLKDIIEFQSFTRSIFIFISIKIGDGINFFVVYKNLVYMYYTITLVAYFFFLLNWKFKFMLTNIQSPLIFNYNKVGCVLPIVIWSEFRIGQYSDDDHRRRAPHFIKVFI